MSNNQKVINFRRRRKQDLIHIMGNKCIICEYSRCTDALEFHHIDPTTKLYRLSDGNCRSLKSDLIEVQKCALLCANCHREIHAKLIPQNQIYCSFNQELANELIKSKEPNSYVCSCGVTIDKKATQCKKCYDLNQRKIERPTREILKQLIRTTSFTQIAKQFSTNEKTISDNGIRKWCKYYNLPHTKAIINSYSDEQWLLI